MAAICCLSFAIQLSAEVFALGQYTGWLSKSKLVEHVAHFCCSQSAPWNPSMHSQRSGAMHLPNPQQLLLHNGIEQLLPAYPMEHVVVVIDHCGGLNATTWLFNTLLPCVVCITPPAIHTTPAWLTALAAYATPGAATGVSHVREDHRNTLALAGIGLDAEFEKPPPTRKKEEDVEATYGPLVGRGAPGDEIGDVHVEDEVSKHGIVGGGGETDARRVDGDSEPPQRQIC